MKKLITIRLKSELISKLRGLAYYSRKPISDIVGEALELLIEKLEKNNEKVPEYHGKMTPGRIIKVSDEME